MEIRLSAFWTAVIVVFTLAGLALTVNQVFYLDAFGLTLINHAFLFWVLAAFLPLVFLVIPARKTSGVGPSQIEERVHPEESGAGGEAFPRGVVRKVAWYDAVLFVLAAGVNGYFALNAENVVNFGWDYSAPFTATVSSFILWGLVLEALRRTAGLVVTLIAFAFSIYPLFASSVPVHFLQGIEFDLKTTAQMHAMGVESILGLPLQTAASILIGFLLFGVVLQYTGGAAFFYDLAMSLFGNARGGAAKVAVVSSASMGMMSGSAVSNVLTTGPMTIPTMKRAGFRGTYAAGVEATASTGGTLTPPIMGTAAFLMVSFLGVSYAEVVVAATIPAFLYFAGIYTQVDAYAGKNRLHGMARSALPNTLSVLVKGWPFVLALAALVTLLVVLRREAQAPFQIVAVLMLIALFKRSERLSFRRGVDLLVDTGKTMAEIFGIIAGVGLIVGGLSMTGVSLSMARELVAAVGDSVVLILIAGAITCFVLGMGMTVSAVYVFLAIVMAPALIQLGVNPIAAHLFVIYSATVSYITPPVALAAFAAAGIAKEHPIRTSLVAMRLGMVKYLLPFAFTWNPALVAQGTLTQVIFAGVMALIGVIMLGSAAEGWLVFVNRRIGTVPRVVIAVAGLLTFAPEVTSSLVGLVIGLGVGAFAMMRRSGSSDASGSVEEGTAPAVGESRTSPPSDCRTNAHDQGRGSAVESGRRTDDMGGPS